MSLKASLHSYQLEQTDLAAQLALHFKPKMGGEEIGNMMWEYVCLERGGRKTKSVWCQGLAGMQKEMTLKI